jgi:predicted Fe-Mo cluster-binding NifX family protein
MTTHYISHAAARNMGVDTLIQEKIGADLWNYLADEGRMIKYEAGSEIDQAVQLARRRVIRE